MKESRKVLQGFEQELEKKLCSLGNRKSQKKISHKPALMSEQSYRKQRDMYTKLLRDRFQQQRNSNEQNIKLSQVFAYNRQANLHAFIKDSPQNSAIKASNAKSNRSLNMEYSELEQFISQHLGDLDQGEIDLGYFLAKVLAEFTRENELSEEQIKSIFLSLQQQGTTTNPNIVSLNALEISIRKNTRGNSFRAYIQDKIFGAKKSSLQVQIKQKKVQLQKQNEQKQRRIKRREQQILKSQEAISCQHRELNQRLKEFQNRQKELNKKQKSYAAKQKELLQRIKNGKKSIEERAQKLTQQFSNNLSESFDKIQKKVQSYQRNMKYRIQSLNQKINEITRLRQYKQGQIRSKLAKQAEQKVEKVYKNGCKKYQSQIKQLQKIIQDLRHQLQQSELENNKLMKACAKLEARITKDELRLKQLIADNKNKAVQIKQLQYLCTEKSKQNEELINKLIPNSNKRLLETNQRQEQGVKQYRLEASKSRKSLSSAKSKAKIHQTNAKQKVNMELPVEVVIDVYQQAIQWLQGNDSCPAHKLMQASAIMLLKELKCTNLINILYSKTLERSYQTVQGENNTRQVIQVLKKWSRSHPKQQSRPPHANFAKLALSIFFCCRTKEQIIHSLRFVLQNTEIALQLGQGQPPIYFRVLQKLSLNSLLQNTQILSSLSDACLQLAIIDPHKHGKKWRQPHTGMAFVRAFGNMAGKYSKNKLSEQELDPVEKISIVVQRLVMNYGLEAQAKMYEVWRGVAAQHPRSLLQMNIQSILAQNNTNTVLSQLSDNQY